MNSAIELTNLARELSTASDALRKSDKELWFNLDGEPISGQAAHFLPEGLEGIHEDISDLLRHVVDPGSQIFSKDDTSVASTCRRLRSALNHNMLHLYDKESTCTRHCYIIKSSHIAT